MYTWIYMNTYNIIIKRLSIVMNIAAPQYPQEIEFKTPMNTKTHRCSSPLYKMV